MKKTLVIMAACIFLFSAGIGFFSTSGHAQNVYPYHNNVTLQLDLQKLADANPERARLFSIGQSVLGQDIWCIEITNFAIEGDKPVIYIDGAHHGNEQLSMELAYVFAEFLLNEYSANESARTLVDTRHFYITPLMNVDGNLLDLRYNAHAVDINRNYPFQWTGDGDLLGLSSPSSEPEVEANMALIESIMPDLYVTLHTGITILIYPWGWTDEPAPDEKVYERLAENIWNETDLDYGQISTALYIAPGTSLDWAYHEYGIIAYCIEVDDEQWVPLSAQDLRGRLWQSFWALEYSSHNVDHLGANVGVKNVGIGAADGGYRVFFNFSNTGWGDAANFTASVLVDGAEHAIKVPDMLVSGVKWSFSLPLDKKADGAQVSVYLEYDRTMQNGRRVTAAHEFDISVGDGSIVVISGEDIVASLDESGSRQTPGFEALLAMLGCICMAVIRRKKRD